MLMSMMSAPLSALYFAASAIMAGSAPAICTTRGSTSPSWLPRRMVFSEPHSSELDATISETAMPAPMRLHRLRNGRSVTPAMGATIRLFLSWIGPIFKWGGAFAFRSGCDCADAEKVLILYAAQIRMERKFVTTAIRVADLQHLSSPLGNDEAKRGHRLVESLEREGPGALVRDIGAEGGNDALG